MKILITIPHYYCHEENSNHGSMKKDPAPRIEALTGCITSIHQHLGESQCFMDHFLKQTFPANIHQQHKIDILICTTRQCHILGELSLPYTGYSHVETDAEPMLLGFECARIMKGHLGEYDYYCYMEDDLIIPDSLFLQKIKWFTDATSSANLLQPNRFELSRNHSVLKCYLDGNVGDIYSCLSLYPTDGPEFSANFFGSYFRFCQPLNPHSGCFFLNAEQFEYWTMQPYFNEKDTSFIGPLESAASIGIMKTFNIYKPVPDNANFLEIEHHGNSFIKMIAKTNGLSDK
jgi:hypothetical protein